jgi:hypothetical protein
MPDFGIMRGFNEKLFGDKLVAGQLPTQLGLIGSQEVFDIDPDAQAFFDRVTAAGGSLSATEKTAVDTLVKQMKLDGTWTPMKAIYPMVGASAAACAQNLKSASFTGSFTSGWTFASTGATPNGTSAYMSTGLIPSTELTINNTHLSFYSRSNSLTTFGYDMACFNSGTQVIGISAYYASLTSGLSFQYTTTTPGGIYGFNTNTLGLFIGNKLSTSHKFFKNNTLLTSATGNAGSLPTVNIGIGGFGTEFSNRQCAFASIGDGLTDTQASNFYTAVQAFQTTLSRNV